MFSNLKIVMNIARAFFSIYPKLERYGVHGVVLNWFESYLENRSLVAKITTGPNKIVKSDNFGITYGTAQGSCLRPLLFIIFMNGIHLLPLYSNVILFAGDMTIFNSHKSQKFLKYSLEHDLNLMIDWFNSCVGSLELTCYMIFISHYDV